MPDGGAGSAGSAASLAAGTAGLTGVGGTSTAGAASGGAAGVAAHAGAGQSARTPCSARAGLLFCDDFEGAGPLSAPWSVALNGNGTVAIDRETPAHSGSRSIHVHGDGFQSLLVFHDPARLPQASGAFYVRVFVRVAQPLSSGHNTFLIADTFSAPGAGNAARLGEMNGMLMMTVGGDAHGYLSNQNYYTDKLPGVVLQPLQYACLEMYFDAPKQEIAVQLDGHALADLRVTGLPHESYDAVRFGFEKYAGPVSDLWYDDIAIGSQPIGCD